MKTSVGMKNKGFTLIELVIAIVILGILAVVAAPRFLNLQKDSKVAVMETVEGAMRAGLEMVHTRAIVEGLDQGEQEIVINGVVVPLRDGYPRVDGNDSFDDMNKQVLAWLNIDAVSLTTAQKDPNAADLFTDKSTPNNQIYIFFTSDLDKKSVNFQCQVMYQNITTPEVRLLTDAC
ncbi:MULTISPECIES: type II secretion system protein [Vibrio]|uniref:type II secretion system protein n=1 Tax=Vibrio TaxID=662 RepID=UPI00076A55FE|nr:MULTISPECIES: type II secretion system protein [Vibrio]